MSNPTSNALSLFLLLISMGACDQGPATEEQLRTVVPPTKGDQLAAEEKLLMAKEIARWERLRNTDIDVCTATAGTLDSVLQTRGSESDVLAGAKDFYWFDAMVFATYWNRPPDRRYAPRDLPASIRLRAPVMDSGVRIGYPGALNGLRAPSESEPLPPGKKVRCRTRVFWVGVDSSTRDLLARDGSMTIVTVPR